MTQLTRCYLRASTSTQDATRARSAVEGFAAEHGLVIAASYVENESGAKLARPELFRLLGDSRPGDVLLVEAIDRLSRLNSADWVKLRREIETKGVRVISLDLPSSFIMADAKDELTARIFAAMNSLMMEILAATARADYETRRKRAAQGVLKAKLEGKYRGRPPNTERNRGIMLMIKGGASWTDVQRAVGCSRATIAKLARRMATAAE